MLYVKYLELLKSEANAKESLFANCLATAIRVPSKEELEWHHSQAYVLVNKWLPDEWIDKYLDKRTKEKIKKTEELLR